VKVIARSALALLAALVVLAPGATPVFAHHEGTPTSVSLDPQKSAVTIPESIKLTATTDRHLYGTGYTVVVVDDDSSTEIGSACDQTPCAKYGSTSWAANPDPEPRHFHAELRGPGGGTVASSGQVAVDVDKHVWTIESVTANPTATVVPGTVQFVATLNHTTAGTPYSIYIYDEDNPTTPTTCAQYICGKYLSRSWADNANPKPGRVRVEVRDATSDVASDTLYAAAPFRRFLFSPTLTFTTETDGNGNPVHKATARTAPTDPSLWGTGYDIKVRKADGTQLCSAPQIGCTATVTVGNTYRTVVEDSQGRNFGQSPAWTLTANGPESATVGDLDLAALAATAGGTDICTRLGLSPYKTNVVEPTTSGGDQWEACTTAVAAGATTLAILIAVADTPSGEENLYWLQSDVQRTTPAPGTPTTDEDAKAPRPVPAPLLPSIDDLASELTNLNPTLTQGDADAIAHQCLFLTGRAGLNGHQQCVQRRIFASGTDVAEATTHDLRALAHYSPWVQLNYELGSSKPGSGWQSCPDQVAGQQCDEYPFFSSEQGGPLAVPEPHLEPIAAFDNLSQGGHYNAFRSLCGLQTGTPDPTGLGNSTGGTPFLGIPIPPEWDIPTLKLCNGLS
jgi:hypothetical protein